MNRVLVVEDDSGDALVLRSRLAASEYEIVLADSGVRGLALARETLFGAILVSAALRRGLDGVETCRRMRSVPELNGVPLLVYSQDNTLPENPARVFEAGANAFLFGSELPTLEHELRLALRVRHRIQELTELARGLQEQLKRPAGERTRPEHENHGARETPEHLAALRELAQGRPDGMLLVDAEGLVLHADRGAGDLLGARLEGRHLGSLVPGCGLEAFVRDAHIETREGFRFDLPLRKGRGHRALSAAVVPLVVQPGSHELPRKMVLLYDALRRRIAAEALRTQEPSVPRAELGPLLEAARCHYRPSALRGTSAAMQGARAALVRAAQNGDPVLLVGEAGTGKERVARTLHYSGSTTGAFLQLRCAGISATQAEAELFGVARGAAHGAHHDRPGLLHLAQDGLLYLDEVSELPLELQRKLLAFLQTGQACRVGSSRPERLEVRLVASSSSPLEPLVASQKLLPELAERLGAFVLALPPLAQRKEDLEELVAHYLGHFGAERGIREIAPDALRVLRLHRWPGNVAELKECLDYACARAKDGCVRLADLPTALRERFDELPTLDLVPARRPEGARVEGTHTPQTGLRATEPRGVVNVPSYRELRPWDITDEDPVSLDLYEKKALLRALSVVEGDKLAAAKLLNLGKSTMYRKLKRYGIN